jgi:hypothetical protein
VSVRESVSVSESESESKSESESEKKHMHGMETDECDEKGDEGFGKGRHRVKNGKQMGKASATRHEEVGSSV